MAGRALITGIAGQDGSYLAELLLAPRRRGRRARPAGGVRLAEPRRRARPVHRGRGRPARSRVAARRRRADAADRDLPPRRADVRPRLVGGPDADARGDRRRDRDRARRGARRRPAPARLGVDVERGLRRRAVEPAGRGHADAPALALRRREARRARARSARCARITGCSRAAASPTTTSRRAARRTSCRARSRAGRRRSALGLEQRARPRRPRRRARLVGRAGHHARRRARARRARARRLRAGERHRAGRCATSSRRR